MRAHNDMAAASSRPQPVSGDQLALAADVMRLLSDPTRLHLLRLLVDGAQDVSTLTTHVSASRSSVSQHLGRLRLAGLVHVHRDGRRMLYRIASDHLCELVEHACQFAGHLVHDIPHHQRG